MCWTSLGRYTEAMAEREKPVLIFVPGLGASGDVYRLLLDGLQDDYNVRSADLPGEFPAELDWPFFYRSIETVAADAKKFYLLGHSMGGGVALKYAATHPDQVLSVTAVCPVLFPFKAHRHKWRERLHNLATAVRHGHPVHLLRIAQLLKSRATGGRAGKQYRFSRAIDLRADLPMLQRATVLWPKEEEIIPRSQFEELQAQYPNINAREIAGSHHLIAIAPEPLLPSIKQAVHG